MGDFDELQGHDPQREEDVAAKAGKSQEAESQKVESQKVEQPSGGSSKSN